MSHFVILRLGEVATVWPLRRFGMDGMTLESDGAMGQFGPLYWALRDTGTTQSSDRVSAKGI